MWAITDKRRTVTWVAEFFSFYPQFFDLKNIWQIWVDPKRGLQKKIYLERDLIQIETFCIYYVLSNRSMNKGKQ